MTFFTGIPPNNPTKYMGPSVYYPPCVTRNREPTSDDFRQPETGKLYPFDTYWLVGKNPTTGSLGDLWYLASISGTTADWRKLSTGSSGPLLKVQVDGNTAPGVNPVTPDVNGLMTVTGSQVATGTTTDVIRTWSNALNQYEIQIQRSTAVASTTVGLNGVCHFNSAHFSVDGSGFVSLSGGGSAFDSLTVQSAFAPGVNPVVANAGNINLNGTLVAAGTTPIQSTTRAVNTAAIEVQRSQAVASSNNNNNGMSHYDSSDFEVDSNGFVSAKGSFLIPGTQNIGFTYSAGVFTITAADGTALSATNKGYVVLASNTSKGTFVQYTFTAPLTFQDNSSGGSTLAGNTWGFDSGTNVANDVPFFLYCVSKSDDTAATFMISRFPNTRTSITAGKIAKSSSAVASTQASFYSLDNSITVANYASTSCMSLGCFRMTKVGGASNDWQVSALSVEDGVGKFFLGTKFAWPAGHFGAAASSYFKANGGTAPVYGTNGVSYNVGQDNTVRIGYAFSANSTPGAGAVIAQLTTPFVIQNNPVTSAGFLTLAGAYTFLHGIANAVQQYQEFSYVNDIANGDLTNALIGGNSFALQAMVFIEFS